ncbi:hypothetical protein [Streptomyces yangpuensis]|uniref:hypothetical protein n=1 Tax=Streptomyces yangpuensis TaxID=1648182 RepID=UPI003646C8D6
MSLPPYAVLSRPRPRILAELPEHAEEAVWDLLDAAAGDPWGSASGTPTTPATPKARTSRIASAGRLSVIHFANRVLRHVSVLAIVRLGD